MDFVAVTFFTWSLYKVFQLECLILLVIKIIIISNQISVWSCLSKFFIKNRVTFFLSLLKKRKNFATWNCFCVHLSGISLRQYCQKILTKSWGFRKKIKRRDGHIVGLSGGGVGGHRRGIKPSAHYALKCYNTKLMD